MKISLVTGDVIDTGTLTDKDEEIHIIINKFYEVCAKYNVTGFARIIGGEKGSLASLYLPNETPEKRNEEYGKLIASFADWIQNTSNGRFLVVDTQTQEDSGPEIEGLGQE